MLTEPILTMAMLTIPMLTVAMLTMPMLTMAIRYPAFAESCRSSLQGMVVQDVRKSLPAYG